MIQSSSEYALNLEFRANPNYKLLVLDEIPSEVDIAINELKSNPDCYAILQPQIENLGVKAICQETACLYRRLTVPGRLLDALPSPVEIENLNAAIAELVFDGVLELRVGEAFISGPEASSRIYQMNEGLGTNRIAQLSYDALKYAQELRLDDTRLLSMRMYFYNRSPATPEWKRRCRSPESIAEFLGIDLSTAHGKILDRNWARIPLSPENDWWFMWQPKRRNRDREKTLTYKLYISPQCDYIQDALQVLVTVLTNSQAKSFKVGNDVYGLLRPDKMVAYFNSMVDLQEAASELQKQLMGCPAQGTPFTAELGCDGLISWGIDPPSDRHVISWLGDRSWRLWITNNLATALSSAKVLSNSDAEPWQLALNRLSLEGINTSTWAPVDSNWDGW